MMLLVYMGLGMTSDLLVTGYYLCVSRGRAWSASGLSLTISLLNLYVLSRLLIMEGGWHNALAYAIGNAAGCLLIMKIARRRR